jgi:hypothetical protein
MASITYEHPGGVTDMYAAQEQFRGVTKMVCDFVKANKIGVLRLKFEKKMQICGFNMAKCVSKRNAGQLPQPFWLGATCGGGSHSLSASVARA